MTSQYVEQLKQLLTDKIVVALDTNLLSALEKDPLPTWFEEFISMKEAGVRFSIPDLCVGERLNCYKHPNPAYIPLMNKKWQKMVSRLDVIIWKELPCLPLKGNLFDLVDIHESGDQFIRDKKFSINVSLKLYNHLHNYESSSYNAPQYRTCFETESEQERSKWKEWIKSLRESEYTKHMPPEELFSWLLSAHENCFSPQTIIADFFSLPIRFVSERVSDVDYNPFADHCRYMGKRIDPKNDGLDFLMLFLTMLSINVCSFDGFFEQARSLNLPKSFCCHTPETLVAAWRDQALTCVKFP